MEQKDRTKALSSKRQQVRENILVCALEVFSKFGFTKASISEISKRAGVADGTVYLYFRNKDDLMLHTVNKAIDILISELESVLKKVENPLAKFYAFFDTNIAIFSKRPQLARFLVFDLFHVQTLDLNDPSFTAFKNYIAYTKSICVNAIDKGFFREVNSDILAHHCHAMIDYLVRLWVVSDYEIDIILLKNKMLEVVIYGLLP